jgi:hypothetical protein
VGNWELLRRRKVQCQDCGKRARNLEIIAASGKSEQVFPYHSSCQRYLHLHLPGLDKVIYKHSIRGSVQLAGMCSQFSWHRFLFRLPSALKLTSGEEHNQKQTTSAVEKLLGNFEEYLYLVVPYIQYLHQSSLVGMLSWHASRI